MCCPARSRAAWRSSPAGRSRRANAAAYRGDGKVLELGVRPEFVTLGPDGIPVEVVKVLDAGRYRIVETRRRAASSIKLLVPEGESRFPQAERIVRFDPAHTQIYSGRLDGGGRRPMSKTVNQKGWLFVLPVVMLVAFNAHDSADDGGQLLGPGDLRRQRLLLVGRALVRGGAELRAASTTRCCARSSSPASFWPSKFRSGSPSHWRCRGTGPGFRSAWC